MVGTIYKEDIYTLLHTKLESSGPCDFGEEDFFMFFQLKAMGANDPRSGAIFNLSSKLGRIYKEDHYTLLHTKYESSGSCCFGPEDFFYVFPMKPPGCGLYEPKGMIGRIHKEDHYTLLYTKYEILFFSRDAPGAWPVWTLVARLAEFINKALKHRYTRNRKALGLVISFGEDFFRVFHIVCLWELMTHRDEAINDPSGMVGRLYKAWFAGFIKRSLHIAIHKI